MLAHPKRVCARGRFPLQDWLVPVVYEQAEVPFDFVADAAPPTDDTPDLPAPPEDVQEPYGFVGRDRELLQLERAMWRNPAGILFHGLGGIGKTTLVWGFLRWLADTGGLTHEPFWFTFSEIQSAEFVLNRIGERVYGEEFAALDTDEKLDRLVATLDEAPHVLVWDNFESAGAMDEEAGEALLSEEDRATLRTLLHRLRGTDTKVLITSRNEEEWLGGPAHVQRHTLGGLQGEERWRFCEEIVDDLPGVTLDREDDDLKELMDTLRGHPLAMRVVLPRLADRSPDDLRETVENNLNDLDSAGDEALDRLYATLELVEDVLDDELRELLIPLRLHERFLDANTVEKMAEEVESNLTRGQIGRGLQALSDVGLLQNEGVIYAVHPALTGYLRAQYPGPAPDEHEEAWTRAFVHVMAEHADHFVPKPLHEQRTFIACHEPNVVQARRLADQNEWKEKNRVLTKFLATSAQNQGLSEIAKRRCKDLLEIQYKLEDGSGIASVYQRLGTVVIDQGDLEEAERFYSRAMEIFEDLGDTHGMAISFGQLGAVAKERRDFEEAQRRYRKALEVFEGVDDEHREAATYHQLGSITKERGGLVEARKLYHQAREIFERLDDERSAAATYHQLGTVAKGQGNIEEAAKWHRKSKEIFERLGATRVAARTYHQLGMIAKEQGDLKEAEKWFYQTLEISERLDDEHLTAMAYHKLGVVTKERGELKDADRWYRKSVEMKEQLEDEHLAAETYHELGMVAWKQRELKEAERWCYKSLEISERLGREHLAAKTCHQLSMIAKEQGDLEEAEKQHRKSKAIFEDVGDEHGAAATYTQRGHLARERENFRSAGKWFLKAIQGFTTTSDPGNQRQAIAEFVKVLSNVPRDIQNDLRQLWIDAGFSEDDLDGLLSQLE